MNQHTIKQLLLFMLLLTTAVGNAQAINFETLLMPGKVIQGHEKYEEDCNKCHEAFSKTSQRRLCLDCHKKVATDISDKIGFHGRDNEIRSVECKQCHSDHLGRDADIVQFNKALFQHDHTDFKLKLSHLNVACSSCHKADKLYREAAGDCHTCHKAVDIHAGKLGKKCGQCHQEDRWQKNNFDHAKTKYPLTGKHHETSCALCHPRHRYKGVPKRCNDCHQINDIHNGKYGEKCESCHSTKGWKGYNFDHDKKTKFPLRGKHKESRCDSCHKDDDFKKKLKRDCYTCHKRQDTHEKNLGQKCGDCHGAKRWRQHKFKHDNFKKTACYDCHKADDTHMGRYGKQCKACHRSNDWQKQYFNHGKKTRFPLKGKHKEVTCVLCHKGDAAKEKDKTACHQCHKLDDVHRTKLGKECQSCHNEKGWRTNVRFDHNITRFPLIGLHATVPCEECHLDTQYKETRRSCHACHKEDDDHKSSLAPQCGRCHNPNGWPFWQFDHDTQSEFKLKGAHKEIVCKACHRRPVKDKIELGSNCSNCHQGDDIHSGNFGRQCGRCHNEVDFKEITLKR